MEPTDQLTPHFTVAEMACRHCSECLMGAGFMAQLEALRAEYGHPMVISSGYRCPEHNEAVSTTGSDGPHTTGCAVDVLVSGALAYTLLSLALKYGMTGMGVMQHGPHDTRFIHLDSVPRPEPTIWSYA